MLKRLGRLFVIRTRWEAWAVIWAIALGAVERGKTYLATYPGWQGWMFFVVCTAVVFVAGPKLLDSVRPAPVPARVVKAPVRRLGRTRPRATRRPAGSVSPNWSRRG